MPAPKLLAIYLRDHHAGSVAGLALARRAAGSNAGNAYGAGLERIAGEIEADQRALESIMSSLGVEPDRIRDLAAAAGERIGRLKPNGRLREYSPLSRMVEIEGLALGVTGKLALWRALRAHLGETVAGHDLAELEARAGDQQDRLEELRLRAAGEALDSD